MNAKLAFCLLTATMLAPLCAAEPIADESFAVRQDPLPSGASAGPVDVDQPFTYAGVRAHVYAGIEREDQAIVVPTERGAITTTVHDAPKPATRGEIGVMWGDAVGEYDLTVQSWNV